MSKSALTVIFITVFLDLVGFGIVIPLMSVYGLHFGASPGQLALLGSVYSIMQFFFSPLWGALSDKIGRRPVLLISLFGSTFSYLLFGLAQSFELILVSRILAGLFAANISTAQAYISDVSPPEKQASGMGLIGAAFGLGFIFGPPLGGISSHWLGLSAPGFVAAGICGLNLILAWFRLKESLPREEREKIKQRDLFLLSPKRFSELLRQPVLAMLMLLFFLYTFAFAHLEQCFSLLFQYRFFSDTALASYYTGLMLGWSGLLGAVVQGGLIRKLEKRYSLWGMLRLGCITCAVSYVAFPYLPNYASYFVIAVLMALGGGLVSPCLSGLIAQYTPAEKRGSGFGLSQGFGSLARAMAPLSAQISFAYYYALPFLTAGLLSLAMYALVGRKRS